MTTPGENALGKTGKKLTVLDPERELKKLHPHGNLNSFHEERRHWIRQKSTVRPRGARKANLKSEVTQKRLHSTQTE